MSEAPRAERITCALVCRVYRARRLAPSGGRIVLCRLSRQDGMLCRLSRQDGMLCRLSHTRCRPNISLSKNRVVTSLSNRTIFFQFLGFLGKTPFVRCWIYCSFPTEAPLYKEVFLVLFILLFKVAYRLDLYNSHICNYNSISVDKYIIFLY
jgi:hypothetical protein